MVDAVGERARAQPEVPPLRVALRLEADIQRRWRIRFDPQAGGETCASNDPRPRRFVTVWKPARRVDDDE
jgi:hypothetical protein